MNFYKLISISKRIKSPNIKLLGVLIMHFMGKRYLSIRIDPSFNCNLFCKMCYFSSMEQRKKLKGIIPEKDFNHIAKILFPKAFQVYIGCGAEPTTHRNFTQLIQLAKKYNVPNIGIVTNGQLLTDNQIEEMVKMQLNEITISCHGVTKNTYERFMTNSKYERFISILEKINHFKKIANSKYPEVRINYTVNNNNLTELANFFNTFNNYNISTLQVRPVLNIGGKYSDAITDDQILEYNDIIEQLKNFCLDNNIRLLANKEDIKYQKKNTNKKVTEAVYCYIGPQTHEMLGIEWATSSYREFRIKSNWRKNTFSLLFKDKMSSINKAAGNYEVFE